VTWLTAIRISGSDAESFLGKPLFRRETASSRSPNSISPELPPV
jgi:hypothetical protein